jgi:predicted lipid-binding transport protein (Tim44 family)
MRTTLYAAVAALALLMAIPDADAQSRRRFGGGGNLGKQRPAPMQQEAAKPPVAAPGTPAAAPATAAKPGATAPAVAPKPSFMQRWGGLLAGLGIGALLASMFGAQLGPIIGMLLAMLAIAAVAFLLIRLFAGRKAGQGPTPQYAGGPRATEFSSTPAPSSSGSAGAPGFHGIGSALGGSAAAAPVSEPSVAAAAAGTIDPAALAPSEVEGFLRVAKTSFIRLQAANDSGDLDDIRDYTTPEMYAEIAMQVKERGAVTQRNEVVSIVARLVEAVVEGDYAIASVRFTGLIREDDARNPEPVDEIWHVRKDMRDRRGAWLIAGIQQVE